MVDRLGHRAAEKKVGGMVIYWAVQSVDLKETNMAGEKVDKKADRMVVYWVVQSGDSLVA